MHSVPEDFHVYLSIGTLLSLILGVGGLVWQFTRIEKDNRDWTQDLVNKLRTDMISEVREGVGRADSLRQETGEMGHSLRTKIHEVETWNRDTFVRKDSFSEVIARIEKSFERSVDKLEAKIDDAVKIFQNGNR